MDRRRVGGDAGADPRASTATSPRSTAPMRRARRARPRLSRRPGPRSDPFRLHRRRSCATRELRARLAEGRDPDRHRQPHRADRRRHHAASPPCCSASRSELGIRNVLTGAGQPAYAARRRGARRGAAHHACGRAPDATCRRITPRRCSPCTPKPVPADAGGDRRKRRARCATRISASRSPRTASTSTTATAITSPRTCSISVR